VIEIKITKKYQAKPTCLLVIKVKKRHICFPDFQ